MLPKRVHVQGIGRSTTHASWVQESDERRVCQACSLLVFGFLREGRGIPRPQARQLSAAHPCDMAAKRRMVEGIVHTSGIKNKNVFPRARLDLGMSSGVGRLALRGTGRTPSLSSYPDATIRRLCDTAARSLSFGTPPIVGSTSLPWPLRTTMIRSGFCPSRTGRSRPSS